MKNIWEYSELERHDFNMGAQDCKAGIYDKWYRYHHDDCGAAYDAGWQYKNEEVKNDKVIFLAGE